MISGLSVCMSVGLRSSVVRGVFTGSTSAKLPPIGHVNHHFRLARGVPDENKKERNDGRSGSVRVSSRAFATILCPVLHMTNGPYHESVVNAPRASPQPRTGALKPLCMSTECVRCVVASQR